MGFYQVAVEAISFDELVEYGKNNTTNIVNGMPWSFNYNGYPVTHENDECYLIIKYGETLRFTPEDILVAGINGETYVYKKDVFFKMLSEG